MDTYICCNSTANSSTEEEEGEEEKEEEEEVEEEVEVEVEVRQASRLKESKLLNICCCSCINVSAPLGFGPVLGPEKDPFPRHSFYTVLMQKMYKRKKRRVKLIIE